MVRYLFPVLPLIMGITAFAGDPPQNILETFQKTPFKKVGRLQALPPEVLQSIEAAMRKKLDKQKQEVEQEPWFLELSAKDRASYLSGDNAGLANPNEKWEPTDCIHDPKLPRRRLIYACVSPSLWLVLYQHGGKGAHSHLLLLGKDAQGCYWSRWIHFAGLETAKIKGFQYFTVKDGWVTNNEEGFAE